MLPHQSTIERSSFLEKLSVSLRSNQGSVLPIFALMILAILALIGATISLSMDSRSANNLQHTADSSALGGAIAFLQSESPRSQDRVQQARDQAILLAEQNADYELTDLDLGTVTEDAYGQHFSLEVELQFKAVNATADWTGRNANVELRRRAVASATWGFPLCILTLDESGPGFTLEDLANLQARDCIIWSNADGRTSAYLKSGRLGSNYLCAHGDVFRGGRTIVQGSISEDCDILPDPLASWDPPTSTDSCTAPTQFLPPTRFVQALEDSPEFDPNNRDLYGGRPFNVRTNLNVRGSPTDEYYWGDDLQDVAAPSFDRGSRDDNCHAHSQAPFHCHAAVSNPNQMDERGFDRNRTEDHRDYERTRYIPEGSGRTYATLNQAQVDGNTGVREFHDLSEIDNLEDWEYENDSNYRAVTNTLSPGTYCGIDIAWGHVKMEPGIYFIKGAPLTVTRRGKLTAEGVTLVFMDTGAYLRVSDLGEFNISAPSEGDTAGIAIAENRRTQDPNHGNMISRLSGKGAASIIGLVYLPSQEFFLSGEGTGDQTSPLLQMIVNRIAMVESSKMNIAFEPGQTFVPVIIQPEREARLVE